MPVLRVLCGSALLLSGFLLLLVLVYRSVVRTGLRSGEAAGLRAIGIGIAMLLVFAGVRLVFRQGDTGVPLGWLLLAVTVAVFMGACALIQERILDRVRGVVNRAFSEDDDT
jgi:hypothetical protein